MKTCFRSITWSTLVLLVALGCIDTALAQSVTLSPTALTFCVASTGSAAPPSQTIAVSPVGGQSISYSTGVTQSWLNVVPAPNNIANTTNQPSITVSVNPALLSAAATQTGAVQVQPLGSATLSTVAITVQVGSASCTPTTGSALTVTPSRINFTPSSVQTVTVTISGTGQVSYSPSYGNGPVGWFTAPAAQTLTISTGSTTIQVSNSTAGNVSYAGNLTFAQGSTIVTVPVTFVGTATGNGSLVANPSSISQSFSSPVSGAVTVNVSINTTGTTAVGVVSSVSVGNGPFNWISTPTSAATSAQPQGTSPTAVFPVTIDPSNLTPGSSYTGSITVSQDSNSANFITIPISATVGGSVTGFTSSPSSLSFNIQAGTTAAQSQAVLVSGPANAAIAASTQTSGTYQWLAVTPTTGTLSSTGGLQLNISVLPSSLVSGQTYFGNVLVTQGTTTVLSIPVQVTVGGAPTLTITPSQLNFSFQVGQTAPPAQTISVSSPAGTTISFTPIPSTSSCGNSWLVVSPSQATSTFGTTPQAVTVSINTVGLTTPATCTGNVQISAPSATNTTTNIPVSLLVSNNPLLQVSPSSLTFNASPGAGIPQSQQVQVTSSSTPLPFTIAVNPSSAGAPNFLTVTQTATTTPATLTLSINASIFAALAPGTYTDNLVLTSTGAGNPTVTIPVTLTIANTAALVASPTSLVINYQLGQQQPPIQNIIVSSTGAPVQYNAAVNTVSCGSFLNVSPTTGSTQNAQGQNGSTISVQAVTTGFNVPAVCSATITLTTPNSTVPVTVNVIVNVTNTATINLGSSAIVQTINASAPTAVTIPVSLTSTDATFGSNGTLISYTATASTNPAGQTWLSVSPNGGSTPSNLLVRLDPTNLAPGTYTGSITVTSSTVVATQTLPVTLIVAAQATLSPSSLTFAMNAGGANPANQTVTVGGVPAATTIAAQTSTASCGNSWLNATVSGLTVTVSISGAGFNVAAVCSGTVTIIVPGATNSTLSVPVIVNVASLPSLSVAPATLTFNTTAGAATAPANQTVQLSASGSAAVPFTVAVATQGGVNFLTATPASGTTPASLTVGISQSVLATLSTGTYSGTVTISSTGAAAPVTLNVSLVVAAAPPASVTSIVNSATQLAGSVAPGELVTIYGSNLGPTPAANLQLTASGTVPTTLGGTQVMFDQTPAPLIYVSATQINAIVPYEMAGRLQTTITVSRGGVTSTGIQLRVADTSPGIFTANSSGTGQGAILNQDYSYNSPNSPAAKGKVIQIYATGEGSLTPSVATGSVTSSTGPTFPKPATQPVSVTFQVAGPGGGTIAVPATVVYAGEAPGLVSGVLQVNAIVPESVPSGAQTVMLTVGTTSSPATVTVQVQ